jgi:hypothetical protein
MAIKTGGLILIGVGCVAAAGMGGFLALRVNSTGGATTTAASAAMNMNTPAPATAPAQPDASAPPVVPPAPSQPAAPRGARANDAAPRTAQAPKRTGSPAATPEATALPVPAPVVPSPAAADLRVTELPPPPPPVPDPVAAPLDPPKPRFEELTVKEDSVIGIRLDSAVSSETAKLEDKVTARVSRDVTVAGRTAIPAGARLEGNVTLVEPGGKFKNRARVGIRFTTLVLADNTRVPIQTEAIIRAGESPTGDATSKIGASAVVGAILGAVIGGKKGAAIGTTVGAAGGTAAVAAGDRNSAVLAPGTPLTVQLTAPVTVLIERQ